MKKLIDIFSPTDTKVKEDIKRIDNLIHGDIFLKGIGINSLELEKPVTFPVIDNYLKAAEMLLSESMYSMPEPWAYQCFMEVWEEEDGRIMHGSELSRVEGIEINKYLEQKQQDYGYFTNDMFELIKGKYVQHDVKEFLLGTNASKEDIEDWIAEDLEYVICDSFPNEIEGFISGLIKTSFYIGLEESPFYTRVLEAFETGGIPAGWVGATPENGGGTPKNCLQLLHYGA